VVEIHAYLFLTCQWDSYWKQNLKGWHANSPSANSQKKL